MAVRFTRLHIRPRYDAFIDALATYGCMTKAARLVGIKDIAGLYLHRNTNKEFSERWDAAMSLFNERLRYRVYTRAIDWALHPTKPSERLLTVFLKRFWPEFRETLVLPVPALPAPVDFKELVRKMSDDDLAALMVLFKRMQLNVSEEVVH